MTPQIVLSADARADLRSIEEYITERSGRIRAEMVIGRIGETIRVLAFMPGMGRKRADLDNAHAFPASPWLIIYRPLSDLDGIRIIRVIDGRRDLPATFGTS
jgi:plasmid stabilization system protein ParE